MRCLFMSLVTLLSAALTVGQLPPPHFAANSNASGDSEKLEPPLNASASPAIVIGFVGGFVRHDDKVHGGVQLAQRLRDEFASGVYVNVFENHHSDKAFEEVLRLLDTNHDGVLSPEEKRRARVIIYGHSWGGSETVSLARKLQRDDIPVMLTIQIDSVKKAGEDDSVIPANVARAVNFYQQEGLLHGRAAIRAADPARTQILGSFRYDYRDHPVTCSGYPWFARMLEKPHIEIECDPRLIERVEGLIRSELSPAADATR